MIKIAHMYDNFMGFMGLRDSARKSLWIAGC